MILFNFNAYRATSFDRIKFLRSIFERYDADIVSIQEIHVKNSLIAFRDSYHVLINIEKESRDGIGIVTLIRKNVTLKDVIVSDNGRIIGVTSGDIQHWNIYPKSGTNNRNLREVFFNEELTNLMTLWRYRIELDSLLFLEILTAPIGYVIVVTIVKVIFSLVFVSS